MTCAVTEMLLQPDNYEYGYQQKNAVQIQHLHLTIAVQ
jgi:hypothetical protein